MNLSSLGFFRSLRKENKQFAVIGLGRFGRAVCQTLHSLGYEVLGIDNDEKLVSQILTDQIASHALQLDSTQLIALRQAGIFEFDTVIVAIGKFVEESVITTLNLKEGGVAHIVAKASSEIHLKLLRKVGADHVVFPEYEMGYNLARSLTQPSILDRFDLGGENSIVELMVPDQFHAKTIRELDLRNRYRLNLLAVSEDNNRFEINPSPDKRLQKGTPIVVIGLKKDIDKFLS